MNRSDTTKVARRLADRLYKVPRFLVKTELESLVRILDSDKTTKILIDGLLQREEPNLGAHAGSFIKGQIGLHQVGLEFANSPERRAAFGYKVLKGFIASNLGAVTAWGRIEQICSHYVEVDHVSGNRPPEKVIEQFLEIFVTPIIDYIEFTRNTEDFVHATMVKYKQRCEWFERERLQELIEIKQMPQEAGIHIEQIEQRLKLDFYRYLFDQDLDFFVEVVSPKQLGRADVLTAKLRDGCRLIVEAKVYDGKNRDRNWIKDGITQAASYADDWSEPYAYLLVYNVAVNTMVNFVGVRQEGNIWIMQSLGKEVRIICVNLANELPPSKASQLQDVQINVRN